MHPDIKTPNDGHMARCHLPADPNKPAQGIFRDAALRTLTPLEPSSNDFDVPNSPGSARWAADPSVLRCLILVLVILAGIALFYFGFDRFEDQGHNLLPGDPGAFVLKSRNKPQGAPPGTGDGGVRFSLEPKQAIEFSLEAPPAGQFMRLSGRMRTGDLVPGKKPWHRARLVLIPKNSDGKRIPRSQLACSFGGETDWTHCSRVFEIPNGTATLIMRFVHSGLTGTAELEAPSLTRVAVRGWHEFVRYSLMVFWFGTALACILKTGLWRQPFGWLIVLLSIAILSGVAAPKQIVTTLIKQGFQGVTTTGTSLVAEPRSLAPKTDSQSQTAGDGSLRADDYHGAMTGKAKEAKIAAPPIRKHIPVGTAQKSGHAVLFAALGAVSLLVLVVGGNPASCPRTVIFAITAITIFAASTEVLQMLTTDRGPSFRDLGIDVAGACVGLALTWTALRLIRYRRIADENHSEPEPK